MRVILTCLMGLLLAFSGVAQADTYRLRPGDVLDVAVFQDPKLNRQIVVAPDGFVAFPLAGRFKAGGMTTEAVQSELKGRLQKQFTADLDVTVNYVQSEKREPRQLKEAKDAEFTVYVTGEVAKPGAFVVPKRPPTVLQAIALSGGLGPFAAAKRIHVVRKIRGDELVFPFNYRLYEKGHNLEGNIILRNGDVVVVPERGLFE
jgi:polysaccharide biosynthesis/export protein